MAKVQGTCDARFAEVEKIFQSLLDDGKELGASFFVNIDGKPVIDLWGGYADAARTRPWERDTITTVWSTTKTITALAALILIDRGLLDPDEKVSKYWPEFAANGKENVLVKHFMSHTSGVAGWDDTLTFEETADLPSATAKLAAQAPWWEPGTASGYHSFCYGHLIGELVRRTTGKSLRQFVAEEIAGPLGTNDFQIGAKEEDWGRVAETIPPPAVEGVVLPMLNDPNSLMAKGMRSPPPNGNMANSEAWRRADIGAGNGHGNARGVVRLLSVLALGGEVDGVKLLSPATIERIFEEQVYGVDLVTGMKMRIGIGMGLTGKDTIAGWLPDGKLCFWGGWGGSVGIVDVGRRITIGYVMNKMENGPFGNSRCKALIAAFYKALGIES
ncbi:beta-lactamase [Auricularia subglabra TFB-10046 SS5]|nr:beta-lactamase [Auricularia subglabra TFB-10046 SS5]